MNRLVANFPRRAPMLRRHALALLAGFACTVPALADVTLPNTPLQTGSAIPPNVSLLFDNSGSMYWRYLYIHNADTTIPTISIPKGVDGASAVATSKNTGDEKTDDSFDGVTDAYGSTDCSNGENSAVETLTNCVATSISGSKYMVDQSYATNGLYYNPSITYGSWTYPDGTTSATAPYTAVFKSHNHTNYSWTGIDGTAISLTSTTVNLSTHTQTFYVPKTDVDSICTTLSITDAKCYFRYQILGSSEYSGKAKQIYRSDLAQFSDVKLTTSSISTPPATLAYTASGLSSNSGTLTQLTNVSYVDPGAGAASLVITISGGSTGPTDNVKAVLYERKSNQPSTGTKDNTQTSPGTITITSPTAGTKYYLALYGNGAKVTNVTVTATFNYNPITTTTDTVDPSKQITGVGCNDSTTAANYDWRRCTRVRPSTRTEDQEEQNFANWYSFYATRMKTAKAGISAAFASLGTIPRVGFRDIWNRLNLDIPVGSDGGLFEDKAASGNKTKWYKKVMSEVADDGTPLRTALGAMGDYYSSTASTGPYGPGAPPTTTGGATDQLACRQNFTILTTDGYWNESSSPVSGNQDNTDGTQYKADADSTYATKGETRRYVAAAPYKDSASNTLADVAMYYWKTDLRTDLLNKVQPQDGKDAFWQHMVTFTISIGAKGTLDPPTILADIAAGTAFTWPTPTGNTVTTIDDLFHAAVNGHGSFVVATNPTAFVSALSNALASISQITTSSSNLATTSALLTTGSQVFRTSFTVGLWTGDLQAFDIDPNTGISAAPDWSAASRLNGLASYTSRNLYTWDGSSAATNFPTTAQTTALTTAVGAAAVTNVTNYIKGDHSKEVSNNGTYRNRTTALGDLIDSSPAYVPADTTAGTDAMLYVGANDGFMHAFKASTGDEVFAYLPSGVDMSSLAKLTDPKYVHQYFVDGAIVVSTKEQTKTATDTTGKNILVGVMGRGGKTVYGLDVTNPNSIGKVWEYTNPELGNSLGTPIIAKVNIPDTGDGNTAVIIGNGYNSASGHAQLFVLNIRTGALIGQPLDSVTGNTTTSSNGMTTPKGWDADRSGTVDDIYAGDLLGNVWEFDVSSSDPTAWKPVYGTTASPQPLYTAKDKLGNPQPITGGLSIGLNPVDFKRWVFFGTGRYLTSGDPADKSIQTWYGVIDPGPPTATTPPYATPIASVTTRDSTILKQRKINAYDVLSNSSGDLTIARSFELPVAGDMVGKQGWYLDLLGDITYTTDTSGAVATKTASLTAEDGERIVSDPTLLSDVLVVASIIPSKDACDVGGSSYVNAIDAFTGGSLSSDNAFFDANGNGSIGDSGDTVGTSGVAGSVNLGVGLGGQAGFLVNDKDTGTIYQNGTSGQKSKKVKNPTNSGRISWREIIIGN